MYKHNRKLAAVLAGTLLMLVALTGCQSKKGNVQGGTSTAQRTSMSSAASSSTTDTRASNIERGATDIMDDIGTGVSDAVGGVSTVISDVVGDNTNATR